MKSSFKTQYRQNFMFHTRNWNLIIRYHGHVIKLNVTCLSQGGMLVIEIFGVGYELMMKIFIKSSRGI